jgi:hypothetical protein
MVEPRAAEVEKLLVRFRRGSNESSASSSMVGNGGRYLKTSSSSWSSAGFVESPNAFGKPEPEKDRLLPVLVLDGPMLSARLLLLVIEVKSLASLAVLPFQRKEPRPNGSRLLSL